MATKYMVVYILKNQSEFNRVGLSVSKKVGNSVKRSRITRLLREGFRLMENSLCLGFDIVIIARKPMDGASFFDVSNSLVYLFKKHKIFLAMKND